MNFTWTPDQVRLRAEYAEFGQEYLSQTVDARWSRQQFATAAWDAVGKRGFWDLIIPEAYGGKGERWWDFVAAAEGMASTATDGGFLLAIIGQAGAIHALAQAGSAKQKAHWFPLLRQGAFSATAIAERHSGTDLAATQTLASGPSGAWRLNGSKWHISQAPVAKLLLVTGKITGLNGSGLSLLLLDGEAPGVRRSAALNRFGNRTLPIGQLTFADTPISEFQILGTPGRLSALRYAANLQRALYGLLGALLPTPALQMAEAFLAKRSSNSPLTSHQYLQGRITDAILAREQALWSGRAALAAIFHRSPDRHLLSSIAKISGVRSATETIQQAIALMGSEGVLAPLIHRLRTDISEWVAVGGTEEAHRINIYHQHLRSEEKA
ncbi:MAG: acyl-CoA dehydrogenase family protein [Bacteroidota bacterium]